MKINKITPPTVDLYNPDGEKIGNVNEYEFNDFLIQLKKNYVTGYHSIFNGVKVNLIEGGKIDKQPEGFFDIIEKQLTTIMGF
jgi:hypothetical protein